MLKCGRRFEFLGVGLDIEFELVRLNGYIAEHNLFDLLGSILVWHNHFYKFIVIIVRKRARKSPLEKVLGVLIKPT